MTDRELLEFAAKAIGAKRTREKESNGYFQVHHWHEGYEEDWEYWNPITQDGDVFRLAVMLEIVPNKHADTVVTSRSASWKAGAAHCSLWEPAGDDPYAATRRAIVRAAAEIGKALP